MPRSVEFRRRNRVVDPEVVSDHRRGFATPTHSAGDRLVLEAGVASAASGPAVSVERQDASGQRVVDRIQSTHRIDPARHRRGTIVNLVGDVHVKPPAGFLVVLVPRHSGTLRRLATCSLANRRNCLVGDARLGATWIRHRQAAESRASVVSQQTDVTTGAQACDHLSVEIVTLWRPTGPRELELVEQSGWRAWPPRLPDQPIFYPVLNQEYATKIARDWNVTASGVGYVTRFQVEKAYLDNYDVQQAGGQTILEYWIPAEQLDEFNRHIVGPIEVVAEFR